MEIFPSEYQQLELSKYEKIFVRHANNEEKYGMLLLKINPAMLQGEYLHAAITGEGIVFCKFLLISQADMFLQFIEPYVLGVFQNTTTTIGTKLISNKALVGNDGKLAFKFACICIFPELKRQEIHTEDLPKDIKEFIETKCLFSEEFANLRGAFADTMNQILDGDENITSSEKMTISDTNINSILQRISPEYTTVRFALATENNSHPGASEELLVVSEDDIAVRAFRLEQEQINIVNKMTKGDQLILACAGSGKSVLLISKCFKAARMNPDKKFLITCFNRNLQSLYTWFIERAGLQERNVDCCTFDGLCKELLVRNNLFLPGGSKAIEERRGAVKTHLNAGRIKDKYYGIFIDEVQMFEPDWYKICFNLLENKESEDHIFVICGDKTQEIKQRQRHGKAPWNAGEGYPVYRGGNKSIRIEKNFRNCVEINEYINRFAQNAREVIRTYSPEEEFDPDMFLRGQAFRHGEGVTIKQINGNAVAEAEEVIRSIKEIHDKQEVPYDEIAVAMYNRKYNPYKYYIEYALLKALDRENIPHNQLYSNELNWAGRYGEGGVSLITFDSVLGLDFQAVVVCGVKPLGAYDGTKNVKKGDIINEDCVEKIKRNISYLYVACTRAKDYLHIILCEPSGKSLYNKLLVDSEKLEANYGDESNTI